MTAKKRILFINNSSRLGTGTAASLLLLIKYLQKDFEVAVVSDRHSPLLPDALAKVHVHHYALRDRVILYLPSLIWVILYGGYDLIYGNGFNQRSRGAFWAAKLTGRSFIWHIRETLKSSRYTRTIPMADVVIANSRDTAQCVRQFTGYANSIVVENGVDIELFDRVQKTAKDNLSKELGLNPAWTRIITMGRICQDKNQEEVIEVAARVVERFHQTYFIIVGYISEPDYFSKIKNRIKYYDLHSNVILHDYISNVNEFMCGSDLLLHTAHKEPQGRVILEAMAARLPVVAYQVGGIGEAAINEKTAFLLPFGDRDGLVKAICRLIQDSEVRKQKGMAGYQRVKENYSAERTAEAVRSIILQTI